MNSLWRPTIRSLAGPVPPPQPMRLGTLSKTTTSPMTYRHSPAHVLITTT